MGTFSWCGEKRQLLCSAACTLQIQSTHDTHDVASDRNTGTSQLPLHAATSTVAPRTECLLTRRYTAHARTADPQTCVRVCRFARDHSGLARVCDHHVRGDHMMCIFLPSFVRTMMVMCGPSPRSRPMCGGRSSRVHPRVECDDVSNAHRFGRYFVSPEARSCNVTDVLVYMHSFLAKQR
jgi:hypothetical protein